MSDQKPAKVLFRTAAKPHEKITTLPSTHTLSHASVFRKTHSPPTDFWQQGLFQLHPHGFQPVLFASV